MVASFYFPLVFLAALVGVGIAAFAVYKRDQPGARPLTVFALAGSTWAIAQGLIIAERGLDSMAFWTQVSLSVSVLVPVAWLVLVFEYTGSYRWLTWRRLAGLLVEPAVFVALVWTEGSHDYVWTNPERTFFRGSDAFAVEFGLAFWGHQVYAYLLFTAGCAILVRMLFRSNNLARWQSTALLGSIALPIFANLVFIFGIVPAGLDPTALACVLAASIMTLAMFETEIHSVAPVTREIGREAVLEDLDDAIFILDDTDHILDVNPAAERLLGEPADDCLGKPLADFFPDLVTTIEDVDTRAEVELELGGKLREYDVRVSQLSGGYGTLSGQVLSLRDVTDRVERQQRLDVLNRLLRHNVRNELNLVRGQIELAKTEIESDSVDEKLSSATDTVDDIVSRSNKVGRLSRMLDAEQADGVDIATELRGQQETDSLAAADGTVTLDLPEELPVTGGESLVTAFEELVSNGLEHNDSADPVVTVSVNEAKSSDTHVVLEVSDNGPGIGEQEWETITEGRETPLRHSSGVGLWLVNWVVRRAGGTVSFENTDGSTVGVRLPRADPPAGEQS